MSKPAKFIAILYDILELLDYYSLDKGWKRFLDFKNSGISKQYYGRIFNTQNFQSFLRQLSLYGFKMKNEKLENLQSPSLFQGNQTSQNLKKEKAKENGEQYFESITPQISINNMRNQLEILRKQQQKLLMQMRIQFQIQFLIAKINAIVDHFKENYTNEQRREVYEKPMHLLFHLIFGHKPEYASDLMEPLYEDIIGQLSPFSEFPCSPIQFARLF